MSLFCSGPSTWGENFPLANGPRQSPIDIQTDNSTLDQSLTPLRYEYSKKSKTLVNTGAGWKVTVVGAGSGMKSISCRQIVNLILLKNRIYPRTEENHLFHIEFTMIYKFSRSPCRIDRSCKKICSLHFDPNDLTFIFPFEKLFP